MTKKEVFNHLANKGCFLPTDELNKAVDMLTLFSKSMSYFEAIDEMEEHYSQFDFSDKSKGAYEFVSIEPKQKRKIHQLDEHGNVINTFESIYSAAKHIGKEKSPGNISKALRSGKFAYNYKWIYN